MTALQRTAFAGSEDLIRGRAAPVTVERQNPWMCLYVGTELNLQFEEPHHNDGEGLLVPAMNLRWRAGRFNCGKGFDNFVSVP